MIDQLNNAGHKSKSASTRVSKVDLSQKVMTEPTVNNTESSRPSRTTEIRPVNVSPDSGGKSNSVIVANQPSPVQQHPSFSCNVCHEMFIAQEEIQVQNDLNHIRMGDHSVN